MFTRKTNKANINIHRNTKNLPTTEKAVTNAILKSQIDNDTDACQYIFMDNRYTAPQLFALMTTEWNLRGVGICKANRKGFPSAELALDKKIDRDNFIRLVDDRLGLVVTRWKDSKILQTISITMKSGVETISRRVGATIVDVKCPADIV